jgi:CheY-like chemotaxis protein
MNETIEPEYHKKESSQVVKKTVLLIDDNQDILFLFRLILEFDFEVLTAQSGQEALEVLSNISSPDLILLDMQMEDMTGTDFLALLEEKRPEIIENTPVVFLTGMDKVPVSKAIGFIQKPIDNVNFVAAVHRFIKLGDERRQ